MHAAGRAPRAVPESRVRPVVQLGAGRSAPCPGVSQSCLHEAQSQRAGQHALQSTLLPGFLQTRPLTHVRARPHLVAGQWSQVAYLHLRGVQPFSTGPRCLDIWSAACCNQVLAEAAGCLKGAGRACPRDRSSAA